MQTIETPGPAVAPPCPQPAVPAPRDPYCRGCFRPGMGRDSECPVHGIDADPHWWRTPDRYRESRFTDEMPEWPRITRAEAEHDERMDRRRSR